MKITKLILFIFLAFISVQALTVQAGSGSGSVTVDVASVNGVCGATHYNCTSGTSSSGGSGTGGYSWQCLGLNGGLTASCSELSQYTLTLSSTGTGSGSVSGAGTYNYNTVVTAVAAPSPGSSFAGWSGSCNSSGQVTMNANKSCTATFNQNTYTLTINKAGTGSGNVTGAGTYSYNTNVTATASANSGSSFAGWSGSCSSTGQVTMNANKSCTATFNLSPVNGGWSAWSAWSACSVTACGSTGVQTSTRTCTNPPPSNGGTTCSGSSTQTQSCSTPACSVNGVCASTHYNCSSGTSTNNVNGTSAYTWTCTGSNGGTSASCSDPKVNGGWSAWSPASCPTACGQPASIQTRTCTNPPPSNGGATCSGSSTSNCPATAPCTCANGAINPPTCTLFAVNGVCAATHYSCSAGTSTSNVSGTSSYTWTCSGSNGGSSASCSESKTNGSCSSTHYNCSSGTSTNNVNGTSAYTWTCTGSNGGTSASCSESKPMTGSITPSSTSCVISSGASSCNVTLSWSTTNPVGTSAITASGMSNVNGNSGSQSFPVPYSSRTFYLYNNGTQLASAYATSSCTSGTTWNGSTCATNTYTVSTSTNSGGSISPSSRSVTQGSTTTFTVTPNSGYVASASGCNGSLSGSTYTTGSITSNCTVNVVFTNTSCANGANNPPTCTTCPSGSAMISGSCTPVTASVTASPTTYNTIPNTNVAFSYSASTNTGSVECRLLDNTYAALTSYATYPANNPINRTPPSSPGSYGYYVQCRNTTTTSAVATSASIIVNVITVSVTASPTTYNVSPGSNVAFTYTPTTNYGATECRLLDNAYGALTSYQASSPINYSVPGTTGSYGYYVQCRNTSTTTATGTSGLITVNTTNGNVVPTVTSPTATSVTTNGATLGANVTSLGVPASISARGTCWGTIPNPTTNCSPASGTTTGIFSHSRTGLSVNTTYYYRGYATNSTGTGYSPDGSFTTNGSTSGWLTATGCIIPEGSSGCDSDLDWSVTSPVGTSTVRTPDSSGTVIATADSGSATWPVSTNTGPGSKTFVLVNNGAVIDSKIATAICANTTVWNGTTCSLNSPVTTFTANPSTIFKGGSSTLSWNSPLSDSCTGGGFATGGAVTGSVSVSPVVNTTYTLTCTNTSGTTNNSVVTKVIDLKIQEQ